jgi:hypothetical protein
VCLANLKMRLSFFFYWDLCYGHLFSWPLRKRICLNGQAILEPVNFSFGISLLRKFCNVCIIFVLFKNTMMIACNLNCVGDPDPVGSRIFLGSRKFFQIRYLTHSGCLKSSRKIFFFVQTFSLQIFSAYN